MSREQQRVGVAESTVQGIAVRVTGPERTLIDCLDRPDLAGGWEELWRSLEQLRRFDLGLVEAYARLYGCPTVTAKVGLYLDLHREDLGVSAQLLERLEAGRPTTPKRIAKSRRTGRELMIRVRRWKLIVPSALLARPWDESDLHAGRSP